MLDDLREGLAGWVQIAGECDSNNDPLPDDLHAEFAIAVGGDGTFISQARRVVDRDMPLIGVNVGRLGFLAEFDVPTLCKRASTVFGSDPPLTYAMILHAKVERDGMTIASGTAINDCVVTSAAPRMIEVTLSFDRSRGPAMTGDGVIVATPTGSTAYNASAGGPILHRAVEAMVITPLAAQSLAFRPIVMEAGCEIAIRIDQADEGARLVQDGQIMTALIRGDVVTIRRHAKSARFVIRPETTYWRILIDKLRWALPPRFREPTVDA